MPATALKADTRTKIKDAKTKKAIRVTLNGGDKLQHLFTYTFHHLYWTVMKLDLNRTYNES